MPEAITKYAINSTLGTDKFRSLDLILRDEIQNQSHIIASDEVFLNYNDLTKQILSSETVKFYHPLILKSSYNGSIKMKGTITSARVSFTFRIYKNSDAMFEARTDTNFVTPDIILKSNDIIKIEIEATAMSGSGSPTITLRNMTVCGTVKQNIFELLEEV